MWDEGYVKRDWAPSFLQTHGYNKRKKSYEETSERFAFLIKIQTSEKDGKVER